MHSSPFSRTHDRPKTYICWARVSRPFGPEVGVELLQEHGRRGLSAFHRLATTARASAASKARALIGTGLDLVCQALLAGFQAKA